eukprot:3395579-Lingulodinium_polyedra.AAC.1
MCPTCRQEVELYGLTNYRTLIAQSAPTSEMAILANARYVSGESYARDSWESNSGSSPDAWSDSSASVL